MAYQKQTWVQGEVLQSSKLNYIENGIESNSSDIQAEINNRTSALEVEKADRQTADTQIKQLINNCLKLNVSDQAISGSLSLLDYLLIGNKTNNLYSQMLFDKENKKAFWKIKDGSLEYIITHPNKTGIAALTSDINDNTIQIKQNGTLVGSFTTNDVSNKIIDLSIPSSLSDLTEDAGHKLITQAERVTWNAKQNALSESNKLPVTAISGLSAIATSGSYTDLSNKPSIPTIYDNLITIKQNDVIVGSFTLNQNKDAEILLSDTDTNYSFTNKSAVLSWGQTATIGEFSNSKGVKTLLTVTLPTNPNTDTKNTTSTKESSNKLFLAGGITQADSVVTYSNSKVFIENNCLFSNNKKVSTIDHIHDDRYCNKTQYTLDLAEKAPKIHTHTKSEIIDFPTSLPASDVCIWAKATDKPKYNWSEILNTPIVSTVSGIWCEGSNASDSGAITINNYNSALNIVATANIEFASLKLNGGFNESTNITFRNTYKHNPLVFVQEKLTSDKSSLWLRNGLLVGDITKTGCKIYNNKSEAVYVNILVIQGQD